MSVYTPVPSQADVRPSRTHAAVTEAQHMAATITRTSAVELGLVITLMATLASGVYAWATTRGDVSRVQTDVAELRVQQRAQLEVNASRDLVQEGIRRDVAEVRAGVERLERALEKGAVRR